MVGGDYITSHANMVGKYDDLSLSLKQEWITIRNVIALVITSKLGWQVVNKQEWEE